MLTSWHTFFSTEAEVTATLTGLLFVALSINLRQILEGRGMTGRAAEALALLLLALFVGLAGALPQASSRAFGIELVVLGTTALTAVNRAVWTGRHSRGERVSTNQYAIRVVSTELAALPTVVAGVILAAGHPGALWLQAIGTGLCLLLAVADAWVLLIEILR